MTKKKTMQWLSQRETNIACINVDENEAKKEALKQSKIRSPELNDRTLFYLNLGTPLEYLDSKAKIQKFKF